MAFKDEIKGKNVLIFGLGLQGGAIGDVRYCVKHGARVKVTDSKTAKQLASTIIGLAEGVETVFGEHRDQDIEWSDIIIQNPGVPDDNQYILKAKTMGKKVYNRTALFVAHCGLPVIGITGTRGKSTSTELLYQCMDAIYPTKIIRGGNIPGISDLELLDEVAGKLYAVLELSSFQLHHFHACKISPHIALITNLYPDHLNRYSDMVEYQRDKEAIALYQLPTDYIVANRENEGSVEVSKKSKGQKIYFSSDDVPKDWHIKLLGKHNRENIAGVLAVCKLLELDLSKIKEVIKNFIGLPFRLAVTRTKSGITYVNDTTSTTPIATLKALQAITKNIVLILGGESKNLPIADLVRELHSNKRVKKVIILGSKNNTDLTTALGQFCSDKIVGNVMSMEDAVTLASKSAHAGEVVLLSPGFASFDLFENEFDRGRQFDKYIKEL